jgi:hypothetical protein
VNKIPAKIPAPIYYKNSFVEHLYTGYKIGYKETFTITKMVDQVVNESQVIDEVDNSWISILKCRTKRKKTVWTKKLVKQPHSTVKTQSTYKIPGTLTEDELTKVPKYNKNKTYFGGTKKAINTNDKGNNKWTLQWAKKDYEPHPIN